MELGSSSKNRRNRTRHNDRTKWASRDTDTTIQATPNIEVRGIVWVNMDDCPYVAGLRCLAFTTGPADIIIDL